MKTTRTKLGAAALLSLGLLGGAAAAQTGADTQTDDQMEVQALMSSPMTLSDAVSAAETDSGGTAMSAEFTMETGDDSAVFVVEVANSDGTISDLAVAGDGTVRQYTASDDDGDRAGEDMEEGDDDDRGQTGEGMPEGDDDDG